jgi:hypothetical protein
MMFVLQEVDGLVSGMWNHMLLAIAQATESALLVEN